MFNKATRLHQQKGFTLIEVLTVMVVLVAIASVTLQTASTFAFQGRDEITKDRYEKIKKAIIGDPNQIINGQPNIHGFVADVGRLPNNIHELLDISGGYCSKRWIPNALLLKIYIDNSTDCVAASGLWYPTPTGWNGPYLNVSTNPLNDNAFDDGWGNLPAAADDHNYGWAVTFLDTASVLTVPDYDVSFNQTTSSGLPLASMSLQSIGKNQLPGNITTDPYDADYPNASALPTIKHQDWQVNIKNISAMVTTPFSGSCNVAGVEYKQSVCQSYNGKWVSSSCNVDNQFLCENQLDETWTNGSPGSCSVNLISDEQLCTLSSGSWNPGPPSTCTNIPKNTCWGNIGQNAWVPNSTNFCLIVTRNSEPNYSVPVISIPADGREFLINYGIDTYIPIGDITISVHQSNDSICDVTDNGTLTYQSTCQNTNSHSNFHVDCTTNGGQWNFSDIINNETCINITEAQCTGLTSPQLAGQLTKTKPPILLSLTPHTTLPTINW